MIAKTVLMMRNSIKIETRALMAAEGVVAQSLVKILELRNFAKYRNKIGPDMNYYLKKGVSPEDIIEKAMKSNEAINRMVGGVL